ncbi:MAG: hypothetical protein Q7T71_17285, partial [Herbiconiux sp.]|nr:hypothetical protein [Herbiconiux sp.]
EIEQRLAAITARRDDIATEERLLVGARDEERAKLEKQLAVAESERSAVAGGIGEELLALYERQRSRYGIGAALLRGGVSMGSNVAITGSDLAAIRAAAPDDVVIDPDSNCILVRTEESGL